jgi:hypothetical protein
MLCYLHFGLWRKWFLLARKIRKKMPSQIAMKAIMIWTRVELKVLVPLVPEKGKITASLRRIAPLRRVKDRNLLRLPASL